MSKTYRHEKTGKHERNFRRELDRKRIDPKAMEAMRERAFNALNRAPAFA